MQHDEPTPASSWRAPEPLFGQLADVVPAGVLLLGPDGRTRYANRWLGALLGNGHPYGVDEVLARFADHERHRLRSAIAGGLGGRTVPALECELLAGGRFCRIEIHPTRCTVGGAVDGVITLVRDASDLATAGVGAEHRATVDEITGCPNLDGTVELLAERLHESRVFGDHVAVAVVALDHLGGDREHHGDIAVDELLVVTSDRLRLPLRRGDVVGMLDASTFAVIMSGLDDADQLRTLTERLCVRVGIDVVADGRLLPVVAFVGAALSGPSSSPMSLIGRATRCAADARRAGAADAPIVACDDAPVA